MAGIRGPPVEAGERHHLDGPAFALQPRLAVSQLHHAIDRHAACVCRNKITDRYGVHTQGNPVHGAIPSDDVRQNADSRILGALGFRESERPVKPRFTFTGVDHPGKHSVALLAPDRPDVPAAPAGVNFFFWFNSFFYYFSFFLYQVQHVFFMRSFSLYLFTDI